MADRKKTNESSKIDLLYKWLSYDLTKLRSELMNELQYSSMQIGSLYSQIKSDRDSEVAEITQELRYTYKQNQNIYDGLSDIIEKDVSSKLGSLDELKEKLASLEALKDKLDAIEQLENLLNELNAKLADGLLSEEDCAKIADSVGEKTEELLSVHTRQVLDAVSAIPAGENVDYERIVDEVGDRMLELLNQIKANEQPVEQVAAPVEIDYDRIIDGTVEKVVESMPYTPALDMDALAVAVASKLTAPEIDYDRIIDGTAEKVVEAMPSTPEMDMDALAVAVASKLTAPEIDYERLADLVVSKLAANSQQTYDVALDEAGVDAIAAKVAEKVEVSAIDYDKVCLAAQAAQIVPDAVDYDRIGEIVEDKLANAPMDLMLDEDGINAIARGVAEQLTVEEIELVEEEPVEETVEEPVEEAVVEETAEEVVEEPVEETVEEPVEEAVEEVAEVAVPVEDEMPAQEELAIAVGYQEDEIGQLVDADTGLVIRLKKSFTAKMKQSEEKVKGYYSELKNALVAFKKINSNVSWHGDRFNFGRDTVAKMTIVGKTLNLYLDLDPNDPELKTTVYHQKDVGNQKAYESTPFMVKIKSDAALKKALRLVAYLAEKLGTEKKENFEAVNYVAEYSYQTTKQLFEEGFIKATKEKKVDLNF